MWPRLLLPQLLLGGGCYCHQAHKLLPLATATCAPVDIQGQVPLPLPPPPATATCTSGDTLRLPLASRTSSHVPTWSGFVTKGVPPPPPLPSTCCSLRVGVAEQKWFLCILKVYWLVYWGP